jgi:histidyl-tRNA synthetase
MLKRLWQVLGLGPTRLEINSLGEREERARHRADLIAYFQENAGVLDADAQRRLHTNPLRILDTKNPAMQELVAAAPSILGYLGRESRAHFERLQELLAVGGIEYSINHRLVRGLDYYSRTVFEWITDRLGAQGTICGGGRYDPLIEMLGGRPAPACGFAIGIERVIELMREAGATPRAADCDAYILHQGGATQSLAFRAAERLRDAGLNVILHAGEASLKSQMKRADASGAQYAVIVGESEAAEGKAAVKALRATADASPFAQQQSVPLGELGETLAAALGAGASKDNT